MVQPKGPSNLGPLRPSNHGLFGPGEKLAADPPTRAAGEVEEKEAPPPLSVPTWGRRSTTRAMISAMCGEYIALMAVAEPSTDHGCAAMGM